MIPLAWMLSDDDSISSNDHSDTDGVNSQMGNNN